MARRDWRRRLRRWVHDHGGSVGLVTIAAATATEVVTHAANHAVDLPAPVDWVLRAAILAGGVVAAAGKSKAPPRERTEDRDDTPSVRVGVETILRDPRLDAVNTELEKVLEKAPWAEWDCPDCGARVVPDAEGIGRCWNDGCRSHGAKQLHPSGRRR